MEESSGTGMTKNPLFYPKSDLEFSDELFSAPSAEYRGAPFWVWNTQLSWPELRRGIDRLMTMGMGGYHIHSRTGLDTPYMGQSFMDMVESSVLYGQKKGMLTYLYDEDRWPSGSAGGKVVRENQKYGAWHLLVTTRKYAHEFLVSSGRSSASPERSENGQLLANFEVWFEQDGKVRYELLTGTEKDAEVLCADNKRGGQLWHVYQEQNPPSEWFNGATYVDTLNPAAMASFVKMTHEKYHSRLGKYFGDSVPSIFTDEPQFAHKSQVPTSTFKGDLFLPWTPSFRQAFESEYGDDIIGKLPEILWDGSESSLLRYRYNDLMCETFVRAFMDQLSNWCRQHQILLTGHMMHEGSLHEQTIAVGEAMRCYRNLDMPGIDILCDSREYNTAKQAQSVARQNGAKGVACEIYGVTNYSFTFADHKNSGDWLACLGVTLRVHHLSPTTIVGESKRDYPAPIFYQNTWYSEYKYIEDHFARLNTVLTRGKAIARVAVVHPIESSWCLFGPLDRTGQIQQWKDEAHLLLTKWLLFGLIDFDFVSESLLSNQNVFSDEQGCWHVGQCRYEAVLLPNMETIRSSTLHLLQNFRNKGGRVYVVGTSPRLIDAQPASIDLSNFKAIPFDRISVLSELDDLRDVKVQSVDGKPIQHLLYQMRNDGKSRYTFVSNTDKKNHYAVIIALRGLFDVTVLDTLTGEQWEILSTCKNGWTTIRWTFAPSGHLLVRLQPRQPKLDITEHDTRAPKEHLSYFTDFTDIEKTELESVNISEPNTLLLDKAKWSIDNSQWYEAEEILRVDNLARTAVGLPERYEATKQPWAMSKLDREANHTLKLQFEVNVADDVHGAIDLAMESVELATIFLDGTEILADRSRWWIDEHINLIELSNDGLKAGRHSLQIDLMYGNLTNVERVFLLGNFSVQLFGENHSLTPLDTSKLRFGDLTRQGLPFYTGNVEYMCHYRVPQHTKLHAVQVWRHAGTCLTAAGDDGVQQNISLSPHVYTPTACSSQVGKTMKVRFRLYCGRGNALGAVHLAPNKTHWVGPNTPRAEHDWWTEEYHIEPIGILQRPAVLVLGTRKDKYVQFSDYIKYSEYPFAPF